MKMKATSLLGIVMCGGKSSRMGSDKGLLIKDGQTWAEQAYAKITSLNLPVKISVNTQQTELYQKIFPKESLVVDSVHIPGPLAGLLSFHKEFIQEDFLVIACDMTDVSVSTMQELINSYREKNEDYDFFVFKDGEEYEPLLGIYSKNGLQKIAELYKEDRLTRYSMKHILDISSTYAIPIEAGQKREFMNYNEKTDL
jgi:molybdopterin-guanine dinucleotide biosynthesis protein A